MAVAWADNVNQKILDSTSLDIGSKGFVDNKSSDGVVNERNLTSLSAPDTFNVVMDFDFAERDENGLSEFDRFITWFKYVHKRGTIPFRFPAITRFGVDGPINPVNPITGENQLCLYKITSGIKPSKSGLAMRCSMTWEEVYSGAGILAVPSTLLLDRMLVSNGHIECFFNHKPAEPIESGFTVQYKRVNGAEYTTAEITDITADGNRYLIDFEPIPSLAEPTTYFLKLTYGNVTLTDGLEVE